MKDCEICGGSRKITLAVRLPVRSSPSFEPEAPTIIADARREYPCPECCPVHGENQVAALDLHSVIDGRRFEYLPKAERLGAIRRELARRLADQLAVSNLVRYREGKVDASGAVPIYSTLYVVAPGHVASLEERVAERQAMIADKVASEAMRRIDGWGSFYRRTAIEKDQVRRFIGEALREVLNAHRTEKARAAR